MRVRWSIAVGLATIAAALAAPAAVQAGEFCVGAGFSGCEFTYAGTGTGLQQALNAAEVDTAPFPDFVWVAAGTYTAPSPAGFNYANADPVNIIGRGADQTRLRSDGSGNGSVVLDVNASNSNSSQVKDLTVQAGGTVGSRGARLEDVRAWDVDVREQAANGQTGLGVELRDDSRFTDGLVAIGGFLGVDFQGAGVLRDSTIFAEVGASDSTAGDAMDLERCTIVATHTGVSVGGAAGVVGSVADSVVLVNGALANGLYAYTGGILNARNMTVLGDLNAANNGAFVVQGVAGTATLNLNSSTLSGFGRELTASGSNGGNANLNVAYTNYDDVEESGSGDIIGGAGNVNMTPGFVVPVPLSFRPADYHLLHSSSLIDKGNPAAPPAGSLDRDGLTRQVDGDGTGGPRRDIGAYEYQRRAPTVVINGPASGRPGQELAYDATGSGDPDAGDTLAYNWQWGDGTGEFGQSAKHTFSKPGTYTVKLTANDPTGRSATATKQVAITAPPAKSPQSGPGGGDGAGASVLDRVAPTVRRLSMSNRRFRITRRRTPLSARTAPKRGSAWRFRLSEAARVRIAVERASVGKRVGRRCRRARGRVPKRRQCRVWKKKGATVVRRNLAAGRRRVAFSGRYGRTRLKPGLYRASLRAVDAAGNRSKLARVRFRVLR